MPLSWNEIKNRAISFVNEWQDETSEKAEAQSFQNDFFNIFGISRRRVASFEKKVKKADSGTGFIDLFWKGVLLIEMKSTGRDLNAAFKQATDYFHGLKEHELPKYVLVSDFQNFCLYDLDEDTSHQFPLTELLQNIQLFGFIAGYQKRTFNDQDPVNVKAAYRMGKLHDRLEEVGYTGHALEVYLVRLLFCMFAEDTGIFERGIFQEYIELHTKEDGSDLAMHLAQLFQVLDTPEDQRLSNLSESLNEFRYINGRLFERQLPLASFDKEMRDTLLECCALWWSDISPAIFGSMFQSVMNPKERRDLGAHYTSEKNIMKLIKPLFLDDLRQEFERLKKGSQAKLIEFQDKIAHLKFLDPACGCGNFLIITYRELRLLEIDILKHIFFKKQKQRREVMADAGIKIEAFIKVSVDQFYGIEYDEFAARIAEVAMWLIDHQMNNKVINEFGQYFARLPLTTSATIVHGNALRIDWQEVVPKNELSFILGNPPFVGAKYMNASQKDDMKLVAGHIKSFGILDYVTAWYILASSYIQDSNIRVAFVSTNSISQGEQVGVLWNDLINNFGVKINFAHRTFQWSNAAKGKAAVHCVIIGFGLNEITPKLIYEYGHIKGEPSEVKAKNINPYLTEGINVYLQNVSEPISNVPKIGIGNKPIDGGFYIFNNEEKEDFLQKEPLATPHFFKFIGATEFLYNKDRWILLLKDVKPSELRKMPYVLERIEAVKQFRLSSKSKPTRNLALTPTRFHVENFPTSNYLLIPEVTSERREYIPIGFIKPEIIASNLVKISKDANVYQFGILTSKMHMTWVKYTCGRMKSDYRYSVKLVYNNYPFPKAPSAKNKKKVEQAAQRVLDARADFPDSSLADLYDPLTMPPKLVKAHQALDKAVDLCYRPQAFTSERNRIEFLFELYEQYTAPLLKQKPEKKRKQKTK